MARSKIDGDQIQDETVTGVNILDDSITIEDLEDYSFTTLEDVEILTPEGDDLIVYDASTAKFINKKSCQINHFIKTVFTETQSLQVPTGKVLILRCPSLEADIILDGELYIL